MLESGMMSEQHTKRNTILFLIWILFILVACNLGTTTQPPTLVPRSTATPFPTLGALPANSITTPIPRLEIPSVSEPSIREDIILYNLMDQIDTNRLMRHIANLEGFYTRHVNSTQTSPDRGIGAAANYILNQFREIQQLSNGALNPLEHTFDLEYKGIKTKQRNIIGIVQGNEVGGGTLIVGAHYDSVGQPFDDPEAFAPGANDNASGVAALLEMAHIMSRQKPRKTIIFVAFSAEEVGREGSREVARWISSMNVEVIGMINIDAIGNQESRDGSINNTEMRAFSSGPNELSLSRQIARTLNFISFNHTLPIDIVVQDSIDRDGRYGDHFSFEELGYPAARIIQAHEAKLNADPTDTIEHIEPGYLTDSVKTLLGVIYGIASGPPPPRQIVMRSNGNGLMELRWDPVPDAVSYVIALRFPGSLKYDQQFEVPDLFVEWDNFARYEGIAIAAKDSNGILGPLSAEYRMR